MVVAVFAVCICIELARKKVVGFVVEVPVVYCRRFDQLIPELFVKK